MTNTRYISLLIMAFLSCPIQAQAEGLSLGVNLEFVEPQTNTFLEDELEGGLGFHLGYEFSSWKDWNLGVQYEYLNGWNDVGDMYWAGEFKYDSKSLLLTARPGSWPLMLKVGFVDAEYGVLLQDGAQNLHIVNDTGSLIGVSLVFGDDRFRLEILDYKRIKLGNERFNSFGLTLTVFIPMLTI
ncbi:MAG: hypothetical protein EP315_05995 [Gammaproteobacteria bacterium]|nr:MAG: hypothetical protein EP315_05995 [Gammaproteobacteria bacterium]